MDKKKQRLLAGVFAPVMLFGGVAAAGPAEGPLLFAQAEDPLLVPPPGADEPEEQNRRQSEPEPEAEAPAESEAPAEEPAAEEPAAEEPAAEEPAAEEPAAEEPAAEEPAAEEPATEEPAAEEPAAEEPTAEQPAAEEPAAEPEAEEPATEAPASDEPPAQNRTGEQPAEDAGETEGDAPATEEAPATQSSPEESETRSEDPAADAPEGETSGESDRDAGTTSEPEAGTERTGEADPSEPEAQQRRSTVREELRRRQQEGEPTDQAEDTERANEPAAETDRAADQPETDTERTADQPETDTDRTDTERAGDQPADAPSAAAADEDPARTEERRDRIQVLEDRREQRLEELERDLDEDERTARREERRRDREARIRDREERLRAFEQRDVERLEDIRRSREERRDAAGRIIIEEPGDRRIIRTEDRTIIQYNEIDRLGFGAEDVTTDRDRDGRTVTTIVRPGGVRVITVTDEEGRVLRRVRRAPDGDEYVLFDNTRFYERDRDRDRDYEDYYVVDVPPPVIDIPEDEYIVEADEASPDLIYDAFAAPPVQRVERRYSLEQVVNTPALRERVRRVDIDTITFDTGSARVNEDQIGALETIADAILNVLKKNPNEVFLIEGHTDAVGADIDNLSLSDRRAEEVASLLTEYYDVPAENLTTKGYGEQYLKVDTEGAERENRRVTMRRITDLLQTSQAQ
ncbi:OmpA family protein [Chthonobacter rhizosphaerae]|uniref:OmpA family protein n=1 Tax=Chthonobacter rhizosphaerae TaxID=2735553 RepID=UPI0015EEED7E|nr:OmpA family protein [Chthonobacter rhizosphaerae]